MRYLASDIILLLSNFCVGPSTRTKISFLLLSLCNDELLPTPKITTFLHKSKPAYEKSAQEPNPMLYPE